VKGSSARSLRVNACRKLGRGGKAEAPVAALEVAAQAPARAAGEGDSSVEGASGLESSGVGASLVERVLGAAEADRLSGRFEEVA